MAVATILNVTIAVIVLSVELIIMPVRVSQKTVMWCCMQH